MTNMISLHGRSFYPIVSLSDHTRKNDALYTFTQSDEKLIATYGSVLFTDGNMIGRLTGETTAEFLYHCRAPDGALEAGAARGEFSVQDERLFMTLHWRWLNGELKSGTNHYGQAL